MLLKLRRILIHGTETRKFCSLTAASLSDNEVSSCLPPIVYVPGVGSSRIFAELDPWTSVRFCQYQSGSIRVWPPPVECQSPEELKFWLYCAELQINQMTGRVVNNPGVHTKVLGFGDKMNIAAIGDERIAHKAPYDFRKLPGIAGTEFKVKMQNLIEHLYNRQRRVAIIAESFGNIHSLWFLQRMSKLWKETYIQCFISIGAPWGGVNQWLSHRLSDSSWQGFSFPRDVLHKAKRTWPMNAFGLPRIPGVDANEEIIRTPQRKYTAADYDRMYAEVACQEGLAYNRMAQKAMDYEEAPGVEMHVIAGSGIPTTSSLVYDYVPDGSYDTRKPQEISEDGDGVVTLRSNIAYLSAWKAHQPEPVCHHVVRNIHHKFLSYDKEQVGRLLRSILLAKPMEQAAYNSEDEVEYQP